MELFKWITRGLRNSHLMQKSNKKNQGCRKMAKNYCVSLYAGELAPNTFNLKILRAQTTPASFTASHEDGLLRNFLNAIFLRPCRTDC